jgi:hypothetical protein
VLRRLPIRNLAHRRSRRRVLPRRDSKAEKRRRCWPVGYSFCRLVQRDRHEESEILRREHQAVVDAGHGGLKHSSFERPARVVGHRIRGQGFRGQLQTERPRHVLRFRHEHQEISERRTLDFRQRPRSGLASE